MTCVCTFPPLHPQHVPPSHAFLISSPPTTVVLSTFSLVPSSCTLPCGTLHSSLILHSCRTCLQKLDRVLLSYGFNSYRLRVNKLETGTGTVGHGYSMHHPSRCQPPVTFTPWDHGSACDGDRGPSGGRGGAQLGIHGLDLLCVCVCVLCLYMYIHMDIFYLYTDVRSHAH